MDGDDTKEQRQARRAHLRAEPQWYLVETNPQCERKAAGEIRRSGFKAYLPLRAVYHKRRGDGIPVKRWPALIGYLLVRFRDAEDWFHLRRCQGVRGVLYFDGKPYSIPQSEVAAIMRAQRAMRFDEPRARAVRKSWQSGERNSRRALAADRFSPGIKVYNAGAMIMAKVVEVTKRGTIRAVVEEKGRNTPVEFSDPDALTIVGEAA